MSPAAVPPLRSKLPAVGTNIFSVMSQLAAEHGAINLGQGFPDFDGPPELFDALERHVRAGRNQYAPMAGVPQLREQIALQAQQRYGRAVDADAQVTITSGATEALYAVFAAVLHAGDEVIVLDPSYDAYEPAIRLNGGVPVRVPLQLPDFDVDWAAVRAAVGPRTRLIVVNTPHNPTGAVFRCADLEALAGIVQDSGILVLSDEVYEHIVFDGLAHHGVLGHDVLAPRSFVVGSFGKTWHCTGWKVGYCIAPATLTAELRKVHQYLTFCTFAPAQYALAEAMAALPGHARQLSGFYQAKRDLFREQMVGSRFHLPHVPGGYFQLVDYSRISNLPDFQFCQWLVAEHKVAAIPLSPFCQRDPGTFLVRLCFAKGDDTLAAAAERLRAV